jgi:hypothetical protein
MSTMVNAKVRFGLEGDRLFDYVTGRYIAAAGTMKTPEGVWNLPKVKELIAAGKGIEEAFTPSWAVHRISELLVARAKEAAPAAEPDAIDKANADFERTIDEASGAEVAVDQPADAPAQPDDQVEEKPTEAAAAAD